MEMKGVYLFSHVCGSKDEIWGRDETQRKVTRAAIQRKWQKSKLKKALAHHANQSKTNT